MSTDRPSSQYDHVYAIIRVDRDDGISGISNRDRITVKKVVRLKERAEQEVERLNKLNADKGCEYFYQLTRLEIEPS